jgi:KAP family P-loop domain
MVSTLRVVQESRDPTNVFARDRLDRQGEVELLASFIEGAPSGFVLAVDGAWGAGKTTFLEMLADYLRNGGNSTGPMAGQLSGALVIEHNAWASDFSEDPLMPVLKEFERAFKKDSRYASNDSIKAKATKFSKGGMKFLAKKAVGWGVQATGRAVLGSDIVNDIRETIAELKADHSEGALDDEDIGVSDEDLDAFTEKAAEGASDALDEHLKSMSAMHELERLQVKAFHKRLEDLTGAFKAEQGHNAKKYPVVVIIDELDRCRPTYAIEMLERIKHLFSVKDIVFVLGIAREQLQHSIKAVYGSSFNAHGYLHRFIDLDYRLEPRLTEDYLALAFKKLGGNDDSLPSIARQELVIFAKIFQLSVRDIEQVLARFAILAGAYGRTEIWKFQDLLSYLRYQLCMRQANDEQLLNFKISPLDLDKTRQKLWEIWQDRLGSEQSMKEGDWAMPVLIGYVSAQLAAKMSKDQGQSFKYMSPTALNLTPEGRLFEDWSRSSLNRSFHEACMEYVEISRPVTA